MDSGNFNAFKNDNVITIHFGSRSKSIPSRSWALLAVLKEKYRPKSGWLTFPGANTVDGGSICICQIGSNGNVSMYGGASSSSTYEATITYVI